MRLYLDIETRWSIDLKKHGTVRCAEDEHAGINCLAYAIDDEPVEILDYYDCDSFEAFNCGYGSLTPNAYRFYNAFARSDEVVAHNAQFEIELSDRLLALRHRKWRCTQAKAAYHGYPLGLDDAAKALKLPLLKDIQAKGSMLRLVNPIYTPADAPEEFEKLYRYNKNDVEVLRLLDKALPDLPPDVQENWELDNEINRYGVPVDIKMIRNAIDLREECARSADNEMACLTDGSVQTVNQVAKLLEWISLRGVPVVDVTADTVEKTLAGDLPGDVREALELRQESGLSSLAKYARMADYEHNGRLHLMHFWYGTHTGRPTGTGPQVLNLPRAEEAEYWADVIHDVPFMILQDEKPLEKLKEASRGSICAEDDYTFIGMDQSQGEARGTAYLSSAQNLLDLFVTSDPYCTYGSTMFNRPINKKDDPDERQAAKAAVLAFGFAGGIGAGQRIGTNYKMDFKALADVVMPKATEFEILEAKRLYQRYREGMPIKPLSEREGVAVDILKQWYRRDFKKVEDYWYTLEYAFLNGGYAGPIHVEVRGNDRVVTLPSGRQLFYRDVRQHKDNYSYQGRWGRETLWRGQLIENMAQAFSTDINNFYKKLAKERVTNVVGGMIIHHCYDEFTMHVPLAKADEAMKRLKECTEIRPAFVGNMPLGFDYWTGRRYGK